MCCSKSIVYHIALSFLLLSLIGCTASTSPSPTDTPQAIVTEALTTDTPTASTSEPTPTPNVTPTPELAVNTLEEVRLATIRIVAHGDFADYDSEEEGIVRYDENGGSGFILSSDGIAVTNNHVAAGAAYMDIYVEGEDTPYEAKVLGVSECSDLAILEIKGEGFHFLEWYEGNIEAGTKVYAAGYPLSDPEYTITDGIISKEKAEGDTNWASIDYVLEHTADINPGSSGGPLVTEVGKLVGINYAKNYGYDQNFAISRNEARPLIERLRSENVDSLGMSTEVFGPHIWESDLTGLYVTAVKSGGPAAKAGIKSGDFLLELEHLSLARDGTLKEYCKIISGHKPTDPLAIKFFRVEDETSYICEGELNSEEKPVCEETTVSNGGYVTVRDEDETIQVEIPEQWSDVHRSPYINDSGRKIASMIWASTDLEAFTDSYAVPGVMFLASRTWALSNNEKNLLESFSQEEACDYVGRSEYDDSVYTGYMDEYANCGTSQNRVVIIAAVPDTRAYIIVVMVQIVSDADIEALSKIIDSFYVIDTLP